MSSPASSTTSTKAATLHPARKERRSSSFPTIAVLRSFRKKSLHKPLPNCEPFEVAPGILNTDATAKVFGYVDTDEEPTKPKVQSVKLTNRDPTEPSPRISVSVKKGRRGMRMVSSEDRLTERGANPRTGLVSPFVTSESELGHDHDYLSMGRAGRPQPFAKARTRSGKWKQDGLGWSLVESPLLSPIAQSTNAPPTRQVSLKELEDRLLVQMPGIDNPEPENPTDLQVRKYQEEMARIRKKEGSDAIVDPDTLPSPRQWTPEGLSSPPRRLHKRLGRKKVGSGTHARNISTETVFVNEQERASSVPTPRKGVREQQRIQIVTPSNTPKELLSDTGVRFQDPFLGQGLEFPGQTQSFTHYQCPQTRLQEAAHRQQSPPQRSSLLQSQYLQTKPQEAALRQSPPQRPDPSKEGCLAPPAILTLNQCLPQVHFQHPNAFANLESPSSQRPNQLLPARLRPLHEQKRLVEDACTSISTFTTTSARKPEKDQRPRIQRHAGSAVVPRAVQESEVSKENYLQAQADILTRRQPISTNFMARSRDWTAELPQKDPCSMNIQSGSPVLMTETQKLSPESADKIGKSSQDSTKRVPSLGAESAAKVAWSQNPRIKNQGLRVGSANIGPEHVQKCQRNGAGTTPMCGHPGNEPAEFAVCRDGSTWFAGHWVENNGDDRALDGVTAMENKTMARRRSVGKKAADVKLWIDAVEGQVRVSAKVTYLQQCLYELACRAFRALGSFSPALKVLMASDVEAHDYLMASKDAFLAGLYMLVLMYVCFVVCKIVVLAASILYWVWHPVNMFLLMLKWCIRS